MPQDRKNFEPLGIIYAYTNGTKYYYAIGKVPEPLRNFIRQYLLENARAEVISEFDDDCPGGWGHDVYCGTLYIYVTNEEISFRPFCVGVEWVSDFEMLMDYRDWDYD